MKIKKFKSNINKFLKNNYSKHKLINIEFISAKKNISVKSVLEKIITKKIRINNNTKTEIK